MWGKSRRPGGTWLGAHMQQAPGRGHGGARLGERGPEPRTSLARVARELLRGAVGARGPQPGYGQALNVALPRWRVWTDDGIGKWKLPVKVSHSLFQSSSFTCEDKGFDSKVTTSFSEQLMAGNESVPADVPSRKESGKLDIKEKEEGRPVGEPGPRPALSTQPWAALAAGPRAPAV